MYYTINEAGVAARLFYALNVFFLKTEPQIKHIKNQEQDFIHP